MLPHHDTVVHYPDDFLLTQCSFENKGFIKYASPATFAVEYGCTYPEILPCRSKPFFRTEVYVKSVPRWTVGFTVQIPSTIPTLPDEHKMVPFVCFESDAVPLIAQTLPSKNSPDGNSIAVNLIFIL